MRRHLPVLTLFALVCACLLALPLSAAELPNVRTLDEAPRLQLAETVQATTCSVTTQLEGRSPFSTTPAAAACNENACDRSCKAIYGPFAGGYCGDDGLCRCAL